MRFGLGLPQQSRSKDAHRIGSNRALCSRSRRGLLVVGASLVVPVMVALAAPKTTLNLSSSMPVGIYVRKDGRPPTLGSAVVFAPPPEARRLSTARKYLPADADLLKVVVAMPGDRVCLADDVYRVNGRVIGTIPRVDSLARPLVPFRFCGAVPAGSAFVATSASRSFDSRYFGPVSLETLTVVTPLWTSSP